MALSSLHIAKATIKTPGGDFAVRGVSFADITALFREHGEAMTEAFAEVKADSDLDTRNVAIKLLSTAPDLVAGIIAHASGEPDQVEAAQHLPFAVQVEALEKIGELTFATEGGPKKVLETVIRMMQGATELMQSRAG